MGIVSGSVFRGLGSGLPGLVLTSLRVLLISVPLAWTLTRVFHLGLETVWFSFAASGLITSFVALAWMHRRLRREERRRTVGRTRIVRGLILVLSVVSPGCAASVYAEVGAPEAEVVLEAGQIDSRTVAAGARGGGGPRAG